jgi:hypothetical protein
MFGLIAPLCFNALIRKTNKIIMRQRIFFVFIMPLLSIFCTYGQCNTHNTQVLLPVCDNDAGKMTTVLKDEVINGRIQTIYEKHIFANRKDSMAFFFNESGLLVTEKSSLFSGLNTKAIYTYNSDNQRINTQMYNESEIQTDYIEFTYDKGNLIKRFYKHAASTPKVISYFDYEIDIYGYDENGNIIEEKRIFKRKSSKNETVQEHIKYQYDCTGNRIIEEELSNGKVIERKLNKYLDRMLIETFTWQLFEGEDLYLKDCYEYNEDNTMKSHIYTIYMYGSTTEKVDEYIENYSYKYEYDISGRLIGEAKTKTTTSRFVETPITETISWKYIDFDDYGNWINKQVGNMTIERQIEYY